jgi:hypothetical protein
MMAKYDLNDLQSDAGNLAHLLETMHDVMMEGCTFVLPGNSLDNRLPGMDRLAALLWIARDLANGLNKHIEEDFAATGNTTAVRRGLSA